KGFLLLTGRDFAQSGKDLWNGTRKWGWNTLAGSDNLLYECIEADVDFWTIGQLKIKLPRYEMWEPSTPGEKSTGYALDVLSLVAPMAGELSATRDAALVADSINTADRAATGGAKAGAAAPKEPAVHPDPPVHSDPAVASDSASTRVQGELSRHGEDLGN